MRAGAFMGRRLRRRGKILPERQSLPGQDGLVTAWSVENVIVFQ
jgi:hypothetical protein